MLRRQSERALEENVLDRLETGAGPSEAGKSVSCSMELWMALVLSVSICFMFYGTPYGSRSVFF